VRKVTAILFLFVVMLSMMHIAEFFKINNFIKHYTEHKLTEQQMTLWEFITLHYMNGDVEDADYKQDMQLPFKELANHGNINITLDQPRQAINIKPNIEITFRKFLHRNLSIPANFYTTNIWQPPRA